MSRTESPRVSEDLRYELADAARVAEVANRPRSLLVLSTLLFLVMGLALIWALREYESASSELRAQSRRLATVVNLEPQYERVRRMAESGSSGGERMTDLYSRIEAAATAAGLVNKPTIPPEKKQPVGMLIKNVYEYKMQDPSLENLLAWVENARERVPGLEVSSLEISPAAKHWNFNVTFVRWERPS